MLKTTVKKRTFALTIIMALAMIMASKTAFGKVVKSFESTATSTSSTFTNPSMISAKSTKLVSADEGGTVSVYTGLSIVIPPGALDEDTSISAELEWKRKSIKYRFFPSPMTFNVPVELRATWSCVEAMGLKDFVLYGEGEQIEPEVTEDGLIWQIPHFSLYYYRRR